MAFGVNEENDWLQVEKEIACLFCKESKPGSRRGSKSKKKLQKQGQLMITGPGHHYMCMSCHSRCHYIVERKYMSYSYMLVASSLSTGQYMWGRFSNDCLIDWLIDL